MIMGGLYELPIFYVFIKNKMHLNILKAFLI